jgi:spore coat polysaccharide biosynthesis protein SpsF (cytidylyltransferase family)
MTTACIVQARVASTRLPAKVLKEVAGEPILGHVLRRCRAIPGNDIVVCATVNNAECGPIAAIAESYGALVFKGSEIDVLDRYLKAARSVDADVIMRVTSDCPLIDPGLCGAVLKAHEQSNADYSANFFSHGFPHGLDCDAFSRALLERCAREASEGEDREHVTLWMRRRPELRRGRVDGPGGACAGWRWTVDYEEDLAFLRALFAYLPPPPSIPSWTEIAETIDRHPELAQINANRRQR